MSNLAKRALEARNEVETILALAEHTGKYSETDAAKVDTLMEEAKRIESLLDRGADTPPASLLVDGLPKPQRRTVRDIDGREHYLYRKGERIADFAPRTDNGLDLEGFGNAIAALITGNVGIHGEQVRALSTTSNTGGGFFVTEELGGQLLDLARSKARTFEAGTSTLQMNSDSLRIVTLGSDPTIEPVGENQPIPSSDPSFGSRLLVAKKHGVIVKVSNELLADAANVGAAITNVLGSTFAQYLDRLVLDHLFGDAELPGTGSVGGIHYDDLLDALNAIRLLNGEPKAAILNPATVNALSKLKTATEMQYLSPPAALSTVAMLDSTAVASTHLVMGDFTEAVVGIRGGLSVELSREAGDSFEHDQTFIRLLWRGDVAVMRKHFHVLSGLTY